MTSKSAFSNEELYTLWKAPYLAALTVMAAQPGGLFSEMIASVRSAIEAREKFQSELLQFLLELDSSEADQFGKRIQEEAGKQEQLTLEDVLSQAIGAIRMAVKCLKEKATPQEVEEYREMIIQRAEKIAGAASEGGMFGFGGVKVSENEQQVLDELRLAVKRQF